ncbi:MAG TPA: riboflavin kinase [Rhizomicrobium sp.]|nr:riboflavin kinase [Rhizomicrobium sp.]
MNKTPDFRFAAAPLLLERHWEIEAVVEHGDARGRTMGFPTANMHLEEGYPLAYGVYAVRVAIMRNGEVESRHDAVANFGIRPMYRTARPLLEAHLFDFDGDLYGRTLQVEFVAFLRPEASFAGLEALIAQIHVDAQQARDMLEFFTRGGVALASIA